MITEQEPDEAAWADAQAIANGDRTIGSWEKIDQATERARLQIRERERRRAVLQKMAADAEEGGLDQALDVSLDQVLALEARADGRLAYARFRVELLLRQLWERFSK